jgi:hypothetical protein
MKQIEKLKQLSKSALNDKDYSLILKFIRDHDFDSISDIIKSETIKEYRLCEPENMTDRYCKLQEISYLLIGLDISDTYMDKCVNYEED